LKSFRLPSTKNGILNYKEKNNVIVYMKGATVIMGGLVKPIVRARILAADPIDVVCGQVLSARGYDLISMSKTPKPADLIKEIHAYDGLIVRSGTTVTPDIFAAASRLRIVGRAGVGIDNVDVAEATRRGIMVMNVPDGNTRSTAELTLSLIMALARNIPAAAQSMKAGKWERSKFMGAELAGKVIGVIGTGRIGSTVAKWCNMLGMTVIAYDPSISAELIQVGIESVSLDDIFKRSDFITVHTPKTKQTTNLICTETLKKCKKGVRIINVARGGIVHEVDLLIALNAGHVAGAALDVFTKEPPPPELASLCNHPAVICTPHLGASTTEAQINVARDIAIQMADALEGKAYVGVVNKS
jgi:D-3-phosphoglycerate dehydrogenase